MELNITSTGSFKSSVAVIQEASFVFLFAKLTPVKNNMKGIESVLNVKKKKKKNH